MKDEKRNKKLIVTFNLKKEQDDTEKTIIEKYKKAYHLLESFEEYINKENKGVNEINSNYKNLNIPDTTILGDELKTMIILFSDKSDTHIAKLKAYDIRKFVAERFKSNGVNFKHLFVGILSDWSVSDDIMDHPHNEIFSRLN